MNRIKEFFGNHKKKIIGSVLTMAILFGIGVTMGNMNSKPKNNILLTVEEQQAREERLQREEELQYIHNMTNTVIVSKDIWDKKSITKNTIEKAKKLKVTQEDEQIQEYFSQWENGNFSNSVEFHNYVWNRLGGTVGKATGLNDIEIEKVVERLK